jgi:hypothetical protein
MYVDLETMRYTTGYRKITRGNGLAGEESRCLHDQGRKKKEPPSQKPEENFPGGF